MRIIILSITSDTACRFILLSTSSWENRIEVIMKNSYIRYILGIILILYIIVMAVLIWQEREKKKLWTSRGSYRRKEKISDRYFSTVYRILKKVPLTRNYTEKLSCQFRLISPCDSKLIARKTVGICMVSLVAGFMILLMIFFLRPRLITLIISAFAIVLIHYEIVSGSAKAFEIRLNVELQHFIENEIHNYYVNYRVDDALYLSIENLSPNMRAAAEQIYQLLLSDDREQALSEYYENVPNKYFREFVSLCVGVAERGDEEVNGKHMFVRNMENLYSQLEIEIDKLQRLRMEFMGVMTIVILPVFCIDLVKWFFISLKDNMRTFYYGKTGFLIDIGLLCITSVIYVVMCKSAEYRTFHLASYQWLYVLERMKPIRRALDNYCDKYASKLERLRKILKNNGYNIKPRHFILRSCILAAAVFLAGIGIVNYLNYSSRRELMCAETSEMEALTSAAEKKQYEKMAEVVSDYIKQYLIKDKDGYQKAMPESFEELSIILEKERIFAGKLINEALAKEVLNRVEKYRAAHMSFPDLIICILLGIIAFFLPDILLSYSISVSKDAMEDEINQFNALIGMLMYDSSMTERRILRELESFAVVFKQSLRSCINDYSSGDIKALEKLKEEEPYPAFIRIVDNLIRCDDMPVYEAFHEVDVEREGYLAKRKLTNEKSIKKRVMRAYLLASIPLILLFVYGVLPTLLSSMNEITETIKLLENGL